MTDQEAVAEAKRRWGEAGHVRHDPGGAEDSFKVGIRRVQVFLIKGIGQTWETAFEAVDRRAKKLP